MKLTAAHQPLHRSAGWILLAVFAVLQFQILPLLTLAAAVLDGGHEVEMSAGRDGVSMVLHHHRSPGSCCSDLPPGHHHTGWIRLIAGADTGREHPDHQLFFASGGQPANPGQSTGMLTAPPVLELPAIFIRAPFCMGAAELEIRHHKKLWWPPPPADCAWGCTVLMI